MKAASALLVLLVAGIYVLTGCSTEGVAVRSSATSGASPRPVTGPEGTSIVPAEKNPFPYDQLWDPCSVNLDYFDELGLGQGRYNGKARPFDRPPLAKSCGFHSKYRTSGSGPDAKKMPNFDLQIMVFKSSFEEAFTNISNGSIKSTTVGGRKAHLFRNKPFSVDESCLIVWGTRFGSIWVSVAIVGSDPPPSAVPICHNLAEIVWRQAPR